MFGLSNLENLLFVDIWLHVVTIIVPENHIFTYSLGGGDALVILLIFESVKDVSLQPVTVSLVHFNDDFIIVFVPWVFIVLIM